MSVLRQLNILGQQRLDVPHIRSLESSIAADFDVLAGRVEAGQRPIVIRGFTLTNITAGTGASNVQLSVADGIVYNINASEAGTFLWVPADRPVEVLNSATNARVDGAFTAGQVNYIGIDLRRSADDSTSDLVQFLDANTLLEEAKNVPLGRTLDYRIVISTTPFSSSTNIIPIAKIKTDALNQIDAAVTAVEDARNLMYRLASGGDFPNRYNSFTWPRSRTEQDPLVASQSVLDKFAGGDKDIKSSKEWHDAIMSRLWELGGGQHWYSPTADRNVKMVGSPSPAVFTMTSDNFEWGIESGAVSVGLYAVNHLHWQGIKFLFDNSDVPGVFQNTVVDQISDDVGNPATAIGSKTALAIGDCIYVDLDRTQNATVVAKKAAMQALGTPTIPGSRHIIAYRTAEGTFRRDSVNPINTSYPVATIGSPGSVRLAYVAGTPATPTVAPLNATNSIIIGAGAYLITGGNTAITGTGGAGGGTGVKGFGGGASGYGVEGVGGTAGYGVRGTGGSSSGIGVVGQGVGAFYGVWGTGGAGGTGVFGQGGTGTGIGVEGAGVGVSSGVKGTSGTTINALGGEFISIATTTGIGVKATGSLTGAGVQGLGGATNGSYGGDFTSLATNGHGVKALATGSGNAIVANSTTATTILATSTTGVTIVASGTGTSVATFTNTSGSGGGIRSIGTGSGIGGYFWSDSGRAIDAYNEANTEFVASFQNGDGGPAAYFSGSNGDGNSVVRIVNLAGDPALAGLEIAAGSAKGIIVGGTGDGIVANVAGGGGTAALFTASTGIGALIATTSGVGVQIGTTSGRGVNITTTSGRGIEIVTTTGKGIEIETDSGRGIDLNTTGGADRGISIVIQGGGTGLWVDGEDGPAAYFEGFSDTQPVVHITQLGNSTNSVPLKVSQELTNTDYRVIEIAGPVPPIGSTAPNSVCVANLIRAWFLWPSTSDASLSSGLSFSVASATRTVGGVLTVNFPVGTFANANYMPIFTWYSNGATQRTPIVMFGTQTATSWSVSIKAGDGSGSAVDLTAGNFGLHVAFIGMGS